MQRETTTDRIARQMVEQYGRGAAIIADQRARSYIASGEFGLSRQWLDAAAAIRKAGAPAS